MDEERLGSPSHPGDVSDHSARDKHLTRLIADKCQGEIRLEPETFHKSFVDFYETVASKEPTGFEQQRCKNKGLGFTGTETSSSHSEKYVDTYSRSLVIFCIWFQILGENSPKIDQSLDYKQNPSLWTIKTRGTRDLTVGTWRPWCLQVHLLKPGRSHTGCFSFFASSQLIKRSISLILMVCSDSAGSVSFRWCNVAVHELASCRRGGVGGGSLLLSRLRFWSVSY